MSGVATLGLDAADREHGLARDADTLTGDATWAGKVLVAEVTEGGLRGILIGRPDADGKMQMERSGLTSEAIIALRWVGSVELGDWLKAGQWSWFVQAKPGELP